jgi:hypothetical protein
MFESIKNFIDDFFSKPFTEFSGWEVLILLTVFVCLFFLVKFLLKFFVKGAKLIGRSIKKHTPTIKKKAHKEICIRCKHTIDTCVCPSNKDKSNWYKLRKNKKDKKALKINTTKGK